MRVNYVKKATGSKKNPWPAEGKRCMKCSKPIKKGEPYKWAKGRYSSTRIACGTCSFSRADLTDSIKAEVYSAFEAALLELEDADESTDFSSIIDPLVSTVREVEDQYRSVADEYFSGGGPNAELADECDSVASDLESIETPEIANFEDWCEKHKEEVDHDNEEEEIEDDLRDQYNEYVQEIVNEFRDAIEGADQL